MFLIFRFLSFGLFEIIKVFKLLLLKQLELINIYIRLLLIFNPYC